MCAVFLPDAVLGPELLRERGSHQLPSDVRRGREVTLAHLSAWAGGKLVQLHLEDRVLAANEEHARLSFVDGGLGLTSPRRDMPRPRGALDCDILGSGTTGPQGTMSMHHKYKHESKGVWRYWQLKKFSTKKLGLYIHIGCVLIPVILLYFNRGWLGR